MVITFFFRVPINCLKGNLKLASRPTTEQEKERTYQKEIAAGETEEKARIKAQNDKVRVLFETRAEGGYVIAAPTPGYEFIQGDVSAIPLFTKDEADLLLNITRSFDQMPAKTEPKEKAENSKSNQPGEISPFKDYNQRADIAALIEKHGWNKVSQQGERIFYKRPGISDSKTSGNYHTGFRVFTVFSTSTEFEPGRANDPTDVYTILEHGGDYSAASKTLYAAGYGTRRKEKKSNKQSAQSLTWNKPKPLDFTLKPVETIEDDYLPQILIDWLRPAARVIGCPFDFLVLAAIVTGGILIGSRLRVKALQNSDWFVVPNLYGGLVGLPSTKKSPATKEIRKPVLELQCKVRESFQKAKSDFEIESKFYEKQSNQNLKESKSADHYKALQAKLDKPQKPILRRFETNDITASKLVQFLSENQNGMLLFRDELTGWLKSLEAEYDKAARPFFLELWEGAITYELSRVDGREIQLTSGTLSIIGGIQPSKLQRYVSEAYSFDNSDGFLQRFLFGYPDPVKRAGKPSIDDYNQMQQGFKKANETFKKLAEFDFKGKVIAPNGDVFHAVKFDHEAQEIVDQWKDEIEAEAESLQIEDEAFSAYLYKLPKSCFAIALIFHCLENINGGNFADEITPATALRAINYTEILKSHARRVFALGENQIFSLANMLLGKIKKGELQSGFKARDVERKKWSGLRTKDAVQDVIHLLCDYGYLRELRTEGEGRPTFLYFIHPDFEKETENEN